MAPSIRFLGGMVRLFISVSRAFALVWSFSFIFLNSPAEAQRKCLGSFDFDPKIAGVRGLKKDEIYPGWARVRLNYTSLAKLDFVLEVKNQGDKPFHGDLKVSAFMIKKDYMAPQNLTNGPTGRTLEPNFYTNVSIEPGKTVLLDFKSDVPETQAGQFLVSAFVDSDNQRAECNEYNNFAKLTPVLGGFFGRWKKVSSRRDHINSKAVWNFYMQLSDNVSTQDGSLSHSLRLVGEDVDPNFKNIDSISSTPRAKDMVVAFGLIGEDGQVYLARYLPGKHPNEKILKRYSSMGFSKQKDNKGRPIGVDIYTQAPSIEFLGKPWPRVMPGKYLFWILTDLEGGREGKFVEIDESDNFSTIPVTIEPLQPIDWWNTWIIDRPHDKALPRVFEFTNTSFRKSLPYQVKLEKQVEQNGRKVWVLVGKNDWIEVNKAFGTIEKKDSVEVKVHPDRTNVVRNRARISLIAQGYEKYPLVKEIDFFDVGNGKPVLRFTKRNRANTKDLDPQGRNLFFERDQNVHPGSGQIVRIDNPSPVDVEVQLGWRNQNWWLTAYFLGVYYKNGKKVDTKGNKHPSHFDEAVIPKEGGYADLLVIAHPEANLPPNIYDGKIILSSCVKNDHYKIFVRDHVKGNSSVIPARLTYLGEGCNGQQYHQPTLESGYPIPMNSGGGGRCKEPWRCQCPPECCNDKCECEKKCGGNGPPGFGPKKGGGGSGTVEFKLWGRNGPAFSKGLVFFSDRSIKNQIGNCEIFMNSSTLAVLGNIAVDKDGKYEYTLKVDSRIQRSLYGKNATLQSVFFVGNSCWFSNAVEWKIGNK